MEVEFVYQVTGTEGWDAIRRAAERAALLNANFSGYTIDPPADGSDEGIVRLRATGHDRSAVVRKIVAPIRAIFARAHIHHSRIHLMQQTVTPTRRNLTLAEGRTPMNTYATGSLREMLEDAGRIERAGLEAEDRQGGEEDRGVCDEDAPQE